jgi:hypothetical protein
MNFCLCWIHQLFLSLLSCGARTGPCPSFLFFNAMKLYIISNFRAYVHFWPSYYDKATNLRFVTKSGKFWMLHFSLSIAASFRTHKTYQSENIWMPQFSLSTSSSFGTHKISQVQHLPRHVNFPKRINIRM